MKAKTLAQAWLEVEMDYNGLSLGDAINKLNRHLKSAHTHSRIREWQDSRGGRGERLPRQVRQYMGRRVIRVVLEEAGVSTQKLDSRTLNKLVDRLC